MGVPARSYFNASRPSSGLAVITRHQAGCTGPSNTRNSSTWLKKVAWAAVPLTQCWGEQRRLHMRILEILWWIHQFLKLPKPVKSTEMLMTIMILFIKYRSSKILPNLSVWALAMYHTMKLRLQRAHEKVPTG